MQIIYTVLWLFIKGDIQNIDTLTTYIFYYIKYIIYTFMMYRKKRNFWFFNYSVINYNVLFFKFIYCFFY